MAKDLLMTPLNETSRIRCEESTIHQAFDQHWARYGHRKRAWDIPYHVSMWRTARKAFDENSSSDFEYIYNELRNRWQVFRGGHGCWTTQETFDVLRTCDSGWRQKRLSNLAMGELHLLWQVIQKLDGIKQNLTRSATVAVSKFLHFWNPRLFVIVDDGVIWKWVLRHQWLREPIERARLITDKTIFGGPRDHDEETCDLSTYLSILVWASEFVRDNPALRQHFVEYIQRHSESEVLPDDIADYEAVAFEWFLLGVVEIPPAGWVYSNGVRNQADES